MSERRCGGDCCRSFSLSLSPARLSELYSEAKAYDAAGEDYDRELVQIAEMVIALPGESDKTPRYTCRNLDDAAGLCLIYENRPRMCRDFPTYSEDSLPCEHCGFVAKCSATNQRQPGNHGEQDRENRRRDLEEVGEERPTVPNRHHHDDDQK